MLQDLLKDTIEKLGTEIHWGWDERWGTALMVLQWTDGEEFLKRLDGVFEMVLDTGNIGSASEPAKALSESLGGLRAGQKLHTHAAGEGVMIYAAVWPWVGNSHMSIRIGVHGHDDATNRQSVRAVFAPSSIKD